VGDCEHHSSDWQQNCACKLGAARLQLCGKKANILSVGDSLSDSIRWSVTASDGGGCVALGPAGMHLSKACWLAGVDIVIPMHCTTTYPQLAQ
jgi:hypothetical protein